jgi:molecular chaperone GrpE
MGLPQTNKEKDRLEEVKEEESTGGNEKIKNLKREVEELKKALEEERKKAEDYLIRLKYLQADFENYQKRVKKEIEEAVRFEVEKLILKLLNVLDNLELALKIGRETNNKEALVKGVELTLNGLKEALKEEGLVGIEALGKPFDPNLHEAVEQIQTSNPPDNIVVEELRKGYILRGKVIRPSMVKVAKLISS